MSSGGELKPVLTGFDSREFDSELGEFLRRRGEPAFRRNQIREWIYGKFAGDFEAMSNLPRRLREALGESFRIHALRPEGKVTAVDGASKFLFLTDEGFPVESVRLPAPDGATYCLSTASGCPVGCRFCASGKFFNRFLSGGEILDQFLLMRAQAAEEVPFDGIVLMGMGEPFLAPRETGRFLEAIRSECGVGSRRITVSTVGVPEGIEELGRTFPQVKLAISLHAPRDELRTRLVPYARKVSLDKLFRALRNYARATGGRRITFEYVLLAGVNDGEREALETARLLKGLPAVVNLIPFNPFPGSPFARPGPKAIGRFRQTLARNFSGEVTVRRSLGASAGAACGQLGLAKIARRASKKE